MLSAGWILLGLLGAAPETPMDQIEVTAEAMLEGDSLRVATTVVNHGPASMPVCVRVKVRARAIWMRADTGEEIVGEGFLTWFPGNLLELRSFSDSTDAAGGDSMAIALASLSGLPPCADLVLPEGGRWVNVQSLPVDSLRGFLCPESITVTAAATFRAPTDAERQRTWTVEAEPILLQP